jgi:hypothetical protein
VDKTVDGKRVGVADVGSIPTTSTKSPDWYYTENEWSRLGIQGPLPPERNKQLLTNEHGGDLASTERIEILFEDSSTS